MVKVTFYDAVNTHDVIITANRYPYRPTGKYVFMRARNNKNQQIRR